MRKPRRLTISSQNHFRTDDSSPTMIFFAAVPTEGDPTVLLKDRFSLLRTICKALTSYFSELRDMESKRAIDIENMCNKLAIPFPENEMLAVSGGLRELGLRLHENMIDIARGQGRIARHIEACVLSLLSDALAEIADGIKQIGSLKFYAKEQALRKELDIASGVIDLMRDKIISLQNDRDKVQPKNDPFIAKIQVEHQIKTTIETENSLQVAYKDLQNFAMDIEVKVMQAIKESLAQFGICMVNQAADFRSFADKVCDFMQPLSPDMEWNSFVARAVNLIDVEKPLRQADKIDYENKEHPSTLPIRSGYLERKSKYLRSFSEAYYVLTPAGYLHEFKSNNRLIDIEPSMSLYLPYCEIGKHSKQDAKSYKFKIKGPQAGVAFASRNQWEFRAKDFDTMMQWYHDAQSLSELRGMNQSQYMTFLEGLEKRYQTEGGGAVTVGAFSANEVEGELSGSSTKKNDQRQSQLAESGISDQNGSGTSSKHSAVPPDTAQDERTQDFTVPDNTANLATRTATTTSSSFDIGQSEAGYRHDMLRSPIAAFSEVFDPHVLNLTDAAEGFKSHDQEINDTVALGDTTSPQLKFCMHHGNDIMLVENGSNTDLVSTHPKIGHFGGSSPSNRLTLTPQSTMALEGFTDELLEYEDSQTHTEESLEVSGAGVKPEACQEFAETEDGTRPAVNAEPIGNADTAEITESVANVQSAINTESADAVVTVSSFGTVATSQEHLGNAVKKDTDKGTRESTAAEKVDNLETTTIGRKTTSRSSSNIGIPGGFPRSRLNGSQDVLQDPKQNKQAEQQDDQQMD